MSYTANCAPPKGLKISSIIVDRFFSKAIQKKRNGHEYELQEVAAVAIGKINKYKTLDEVISY